MSTRGRGSKTPLCVRRGSLCGAHARGAATSSPCSGDELRKSKAQLDAELAAALSESDPFEDAKTELALLKKEVDASEEVLRDFPRGAMGLIPSTTPGYRDAMTRFQRAFARLREFNTIFTKRFARELRAERDERYRSRPPKEA